MSDHCLIIIDKSNGYRIENKGESNFCAVNKSSSCLRFDAPAAWFRSRTWIYFPIVFYVKTYQLNPSKDVSRALNLHDSPHERMVWVTLSTLIVSMNSYQRNFSNIDSKLDNHILTVSGDCQQDGEYSLRFIPDKYI